MKKLRSIITLIILALLVKGIVFVIVKYNQNKDERVRAADPKASLKDFLRVNVVNAKGVTYPVPVTQYLLLTGRGIQTEGETLYVVDNLKMLIENAMQLNTPAIYNKMRSDLVAAHCSSLQEKEKLWRGWSDVGIMQKISDNHDVVILTLRVTKADCTAPVTTKVLP
jgi:hypothetical protein